MNLDETDDELAARADMASALQRLGHALVGHRIDIATATSITEAANAFHEHVTARPTRDRVAEMAANRGDEHVRLDRLEEVLVRARGEPLAAMVVVLVDGGLLDDRDRARDRVALEAPADLEAVDIGERHVEDDQIGREPGEPERVAAGRGLADVVAGVRENPGRRVARVGPVIDHENGTHRKP